MFKKILVPTDGSATALRAAQAVAALVVDTPDVQITIALAIKPLSAEDTDFDEEIVARQNARMREQAERALVLTANAFKERGVNCQTKVIEGDPVSRTIADEAENGGYDLIAIGSRGLGMQKGDIHYLGSVTERVIRRVTIPVLVVPTHRED
ncbi:MAG: universal stress protein [Armatimonadota bacterium]|nr:universal stress protein [Armatimonadota bacterium]